MPTVSVIVPVYNVEPYIARCVRSLFSQTLQDMEFVFVDDCSSDKSMDVLKKVLIEEFPQRKPQARFYRMPKNSGLFKVRWQGIQMATGDYIIPCDSDDYVENDAYRLMYEKAIDNNCDIVTCDFYQERSGKVFIMRTEVTSIDELVAAKIPWSFCCRMMRRGLLQEGIIPPVASNGEDMCFTLQASLKAKKMGHINIPLYHYCFNGESITKSLGIEAIVRRWEDVMSNSAIIIFLLTDKYDYRPSHPSIIQFKYFCRHPLQPCVHTREGFKMWKSTYPEVDGVFLFTPGVSLKEKVWFVLIHMHLFGFVKSITNRFRKIS